MKINLIPQEENKQETTSSLKKAALAALITVGLLFLALSIRYFINKSKLDTLSNEENAISVQEEPFKEFTNAFVKYKDHPALALLASHSYYSRLLDKVEQATPPSVHISGLIVDESLLVKLDASVESGYAQISQYSKYLKKAGFIDPVVKSVSTSSIGIGFSMEFKLTRDMISK